MTQTHRTDLMEVKNIATGMVRYYASKSGVFRQVSKVEYLLRYKAAHNFSCMLSTSDAKHIRSYRTAIYRCENFNKPTPDDATHFNPKGIYAVWYKCEMGVWFYWGGIGFWKPSLLKSSNLTVDLIPR